MGDAAFCATGTSLANHLQPDPPPNPPSSGGGGRPGCAFIGFAVVLLLFWLAARLFKVAAALDHFPSAFASFALLLAPYWFFGFGLAEWLRRVLRARWTRVLLAAVLVVPYLTFAIPRGQLDVRYALVFTLLPLGLAALLELAPPQAGISCPEVIALLAIGLPVEFHWFRGAFPQPGLGSMTKLLLMDAALYAFLVVRGLTDVGYDFRPRWRDLAVGVREWAWFAPIGIALGLALHFIRFRGFAADPAQVAAGWLVTLFFVALPEELFFRGLLQNLLEKRFAAAEDAGRARWKAVLIAAAIFGLSHFNKPRPFNWRYVLLATIAGVFYGRAWRDRRRLLSSGVTHATVDVVWSVWFR